jgi:hydrogenase nickel incorporation protein HypA/HybF
MHELSVTQHILETALHYARAHEAVQISAINLVIGQLASVVDDSVQFYWDIISEGSLAQGAKLNFERIAARMQCETCHHTYALYESRLICPICGGGSVQLLSGDECYIDSIEVET